MSWVSASVWIWKRPHLGQWISDVLDPAPVCATFVVRQMGHCVRFSMIFSPSAGVARVPFA